MMGTTINGILARRKETDKSKKKKKKKNKTWELIVELLWELHEINRK